MKRLTLVLVLALVAPAIADDNPRERSAIQHGAQPNPEEVRPGSAEGDSPSASAGTLARRPVDRRILGLPVTTAIVIGGVILALLALAGFVVSRPGRRRRARGGGTYGRP